MFQPIGPARDVFGQFMQGKQALIAQPWRACLQRWHRLRQKQQRGVTVGLLQCRLAQALGRADIDSGIDRKILAVRPRDPG